MNRIAIGVLCIFMLSCSKRKVDIESLNILIEGETRKIDLENGIYEIFLQEGNKKAYFNLSKKDKEIIVNYLNKNNILLKERESDFFSLQWELPISETTITIFNNKSISVISYCSPCYYPFDFIAVAKAKELSTMIESICQKYENVRKLPPSDFYLE